jgi:hypothetical protein
MLEWQLSKKFMDADKYKPGTDPKLMDTNPDSRCIFLYNGVLKNLEKKKYKFQVATENGDLKSEGHFE